MRPLSLYLLCLIFVCFEGCASTQPGNDNTQPTDQQSTFSTSLHSASFSFSSGGLSTPIPVQYRAQARCKGANCIPEKAQLSFFLEPGPNTVYLSNRNLSIEADGKSYDWREREWANIYDSPPVLGLIKLVTLNQDELTQLANAQKVSGVLSGQHFKWSYPNREPLRKMVSEMKSAEN